MILVDTHVLLDVLQDGPAWADWSMRQLRAQAQAHGLAINAVVCAGLSLAFELVQALDATLAGMGLLVQQLPRPALFLAGRAFLKYHREGGNKSNVLPGFFIGAHAAVQGWDVLTARCAALPQLFPDRGLDHALSGVNDLSFRHMMVTPLETSQNPSRRVHLRPRAVCRVAPPRDRYGYRCGLRLAVHPDPQRLLTTRGFEAPP